MAHCLNVYNILLIPLLQFPLKEKKTQISDRQGSRGLVWKLVGIRWNGEIHLASTRDVKWTSFASNRPMKTYKQIGPPPN